MNDDPTHPSSSITRRAALAALGAGAAGLALNATHGYASTLKRPGEFFNRLDRPYSDT